MFWVTPLSGALLVGLGYLAALRLSGSLAGVAAALLIACSPAVLYQVVQPMNDVTTAALWMAVFVALLYRRPALAGACCGLALLVRPNLLPLAAVAACWLLASGSRPPTPDFRPPTRDSRPPTPASLIRFALAALPGALVVLWLNAVLYGSPFRSGYGALGHLFSASHVAVNLSRYPRWLFETHTLFPFLGLAAPFFVAGDRRPFAALGAALAAVTAAIYIAYQPFDDWSYLRFLLPAIAILLVLASVSIVVLAKRAGRRLAPVIVLIVIAAVGAFCLREAHTRLAFVLRALEQRYRSAGVVIRDHLPPDAVVLSVWDSGAVRFHGRREAVNWEALDPEWLDRAVGWLDGQGKKSYLLLESWEEPRFREHFKGHSPLAELDWPPKYEIDRVVRVYDPADRARYFANERVATEYMWPFIPMRR
jgi:hypothetical protein